MLGNVVTSSDRSNQTEKQKSYKMPNWEIQEDIVISGISGRFPESDSIEELKKNLYEGIDMVTEDDRRWKPGIFGTPKRMGKLKEINKFDALFFGVHGKQTEMMDPQQRLLLEVTYEAIFDAGYNPERLRGANIGVFVGCMEKSNPTMEIKEDLLTGYEFLGMNTAIMANRISFTFDFKGPSICMNTACSSSLHAMDEAILAIRTNRCDAAIVGAGSIILNPNQTISTTRLGLVCLDGSCKSFDADGNGYVRSETVSAIFLQKSTDARRCYATVLHSKLNNDGGKPEGILFPSGKQQKQLLEEVYSELEMDPKEVDFIEAHGTGTMAGDQEEGNVIADFFCKGRTTPLLVGSVKSNLGHTEAASGVCAIAKVILSMETGAIPPNLHFKRANPNVPALLDGRIKVVTEKTPWIPNVVDVSNFGFGGSNAHLVLRANKKEQLSTKEKQIPRLVLVSGRTEEAVEHIFKKVQEECFTDEAFVLLEESCKASTSKMQYRGHALITEPRGESSSVIEKSPAGTRPVWFLFSGMGSQWSGMAKEMMKLEVFAKSIKMSAQVLKPLGVDLFHLLIEATEEELCHVIAPFVTIAAVQIALVDLVRALGVVPDGIVGHSLGELGCAYADGCLSAEQMLKAAFWRGNSCFKTKLIPGLMAAVGLSWVETKNRCPEGVFPVCHNAEDSVTISGPADQVKLFVQELTADNVFARIVKTCDIAFHSKYVEPTSHLMTKELEKIIPNPSPRSALWISSSVPESDWNQPRAQLSSAEYHVNNVLSPVLFKEAMDKVPKNALIIEFAPHSLLQAIVKRILGPQAIYIGLMKRGHTNNVIHCLEAIGKMYIAGLNPSVKNLYEPVLFPVPRGTTMLNSLIKWDHFEDFPTWNYKEEHEKKDFVYVDTSHGSLYEYLTGHQVDGRVLFPFMGYVWLAWKALATQLITVIEDVPVVLEDLSVYRASFRPNSGVFEFSVSLLNSDGNFRIVEGGTIVASGKIFQSDKVLRIKEHDMDTSKIADREENFTLDANDFYKELRLRGYEFGPSFRGVLNADSRGLSGVVKWDGHWVSFMDAMMHLPLINVSHRALLLPTRVKSIRIDPRLKPQELWENVPVTFNPLINVCRAGPVEIQGMHFGIAPKRKDYHRMPVLEKQVFVPLIDSNLLAEQEINYLEEYAHVCSTLAHKILVRFGKSKVEISSILDEFIDAPEHLVEKYLVSKDKRHVTFNILSEITQLTSINTLEKDSKNIILQHQAEMQFDLLSIIALQEQGLRSSLDVVLDNLFSTKMTILELSDCAVLRQDVLHMLELTTLGMVKLEYTVARLNKNPVPNGVDMGNNVVYYLDDRLLPGNNDLIVAMDVFTNSTTYSTILQSIVKAVKSRGFVLLVERTYLNPAEKFLSMLSGRDRKEQNEIRIEEAIAESGLTLIAKKKAGMFSVIYLLRYLPEKELANIRVMKLQVDVSHSWVNTLKMKMKQLDENPDGSVIWMIADKPTNGIVGLFNCLKLEPGHKYLRYFLNTGGTAEPKLAFNEQNPFFQDAVKKDLMANVLNNGQMGMFHHRLLKNEKVVTLFPRQRSFLNVTRRGDLSSLKWFESSPTDTLPKYFKGTNSTTVYNYYAALNFRDIMLASGKLPSDAIPEELALHECLLGVEFVGRESTGRRVMGLTVAQGMSTELYVPKDTLLDVPDHWTMEEASTVTVAYMTSYYALIVRGQLQKGQTVLIHSGTGGVAQAAIAICLSMDCEVFTTVGSDEKRAYLKQTFSEIDDAHVSNSRDIDFEFDILNATNGEGVDMVLNSLAEDKLQASVRCVKRNGKFLEIGKYDLAMDNPLGMSLFLKNITFHGILLDVLLEPKHCQDIIHLQEMIKSGIRSGVVRPLKASVYRWDQAEEAFRFMASGKHIGKVVLKIRDEESDRAALPIPKLIPAVPRTYFFPGRSYVITGGLGGFGLELAAWLVERGAKNLVLSTRTGVHNNYQRFCIKRWRKAGVNVQISNRDITTEDGIQKLLRESNEMAPVQGIFHLAMVLQDGLFENLKPENFKNVCIPKEEGTRHLDLVSRKMCPDLKSFVVFSSLSCGRGNPGQSNYGYANSAAERMMEQRKQDGLPGLAIQWGAIGDVGYIHEMIRDQEVAVRGTIPQRLWSCLEVLDKVMQEDNAVVSSFVPIEKKSFNIDLKQDLVDILCNILGVKDPKMVKPETILAELGMDSMMGVEIKQVLENECNTVLSISEVRLLSFSELRQIGKNKIQGASNVPSGGRGYGTVPFLNDIMMPKEAMLSLNDLNGPYCVFFIHPIDCHVLMFKSLAEKLNKPAYGLQFTNKVQVKNVQELAAQYIQNVREVQPHGPYHLVGFSYGSMIAFEMALQLQKTDHVKTFICLDASPKVVVDGMNLFIPENDTSDMTFTIKLLKNILSKYIANVPKQVEDLISNLLPNVTMNMAIEILKKALGQEVDERLLTTILEKLKRMVWLGKNYKPSGVFRGKATLIKASDQEALNGLAVYKTEDYGLREVIDGSLEIFNVNSSHFTIVEDKNNEVSKIINERI